mmetsp:Transcript_1588/g.3691  ORF Transcript_1588/g.3691 Transcript_1588/m.3691 type:complete len:192 (+) Transcript_1588:48-623(+)|eukprot:CAMPEP_0171494072 /NCGR_PEP_ID=MMETSP0958-20121227/5312_1 /TAXON_ID=87120 /ORGANISM="Aurantiochytrium limacinum, Strain ATCCMYA-1381" /LENGTH=191 /DNA_ID=CAMNT_0012027761 /DNA_START=38 /DNA_END=613 /DNA_ORIENTATION=-
MFNEKDKWDDSAIVKAFQCAVDLHDAQTQEKSNANVNAQATATNASQFSKQAAHLAAPEPGPWVPADAKEGEDVEDVHGIHNNTAGANDNHSVAFNQTALASENYRQERKFSPQKSLSSQNQATSSSNNTRQNPKATQTHQKPTIPPSAPGLAPPSHDPELAALLMSWYYAGYQTGRYEALQEVAATKDQQ